MKRFLICILLGILCINTYGFGFKIKMDQTYNSIYKEGQWVTGDVLNTFSLVTINNEAGWIYFNTANMFFMIESKTLGSWQCRDANKELVFITIIREESGDFLKIVYPDKLSWNGRIIKEKLIWKPIVKPFGLPSRHFILPERIP